MKFNKKIIQLMIIAFFISLCSLIYYKPLINNSIENFFIMYWSSTYTYNILLPLFLYTKFITINAYNIEYTSRQTKLLAHLKLTLQSTIYDLLVLFAFLSPSISLIGKINLSFVVLSIFSFMTLTIFFNSIITYKKRVKLYELFIIYLFLFLLPKTLLLPYHLAPNTLLSSLIIISLIPFIFFFDTSDSISIYFNLWVRSFRDRQKLALLIIIVTLTIILVSFDFPYIIAKPNNLMSVSAALLLFLCFNTFFVDFYYKLKENNQFQFLIRERNKINIKLALYLLAFSTSLALSGITFYIDFSRGLAVSTSYYMYFFIFNLTLLSTSSKFIRKEYILIFQIFALLILWRFLWFT